MWCSQRTKVIRQHAGSRTATSGHHRDWAAGSPYPTALYSAGGAQHVP